MTDDDLIARASAARTRAYAPYSKYHVGAAVLAEGDVFDGANVENASYGLAICAERTAVCRAVLEGIREIDTVAVVTESSPPASPCGMCLQTLAEFSRDSKPLRVLLANLRGERRVLTLAELLPHAFRPEDLARKG
ncbi:MAG: cytidine deaminase [Deltaproteobacteria bacterium]|nr:cytidine deaminase [Deltaproteobacteria bacterium]